jgi:riboflavin biosynthesis pyrimidine reductase
LKSLRQSADAVLAGSGTIRLDDIALGVPPQFRRKTGDLIYPLRIALVGKWIPPADSRIFQSALGGTSMVACGNKILTLIEEKLPQVQTIECGDDWRVNVNVLVQKLENEYGVKKLLVEGGPTINGLFLDADLVDRYYVTICPYLFGGERAKALTPISGRGILFKEERRFVLSNYEKVEDWVFLEYERVQK